MVVQSVNGKIIMKKQQKSVALEESIIRKVKIKAKETERTESNVFRILIKKAIDAGYLDQITL
jgi:hypothetical protein